MGNFGKRLLIITLSALAVVALAIVGNVIQQSEKLHKVSDSSNVVYGDVTKGDLWDAIINSSILDTVNEKLNRILLADVINKATEDEISKELELLKYGTNDAEEKAALLKTSTEEKLEKTFKNKMYALGYYSEEEFKDYAKLQIAYKKYAEYRIKNKMTVGSYDYSKLDIVANEEDWLDEIEEGNNYTDVYAVSLFFNSLDEARSSIKSYLKNIGTGYCVVFDSSNSITHYAPKTSAGAPYLKSDYSTVDASLFSASWDSNYSQYVMTENNVKYVLTYESDEWYKTPVENITTEYEYVWNDENSKWEKNSITYYELLFITEGDKKFEAGNTLNTKRASFKTTYVTGKEKIEPSKYQVLKTGNDTNTYNQYSDYYVVITTVGAENALINKTYALTYFDDQSVTSNGDWYGVLVETSTKTTSGTTTIDFEYLESDPVQSTETNTVTEKRTENATAYKNAIKEKEKSDAVFTLSAIGMPYSEIVDDALDTSKTFSYKEAGTDEFCMTIIKELYDYYYATEIANSLRTSACFIDIDNLTSSFGDKLTNTNLIKYGYVTRDNKLYKYTDEEVTLTGELTFDDTNTKLATIDEVYNIYFNVCGGDKFKVSYDDYSSHASAYATFLFETYDDTSKTLSDLFKVNSSSPYYLVYRVTDKELSKTVEDYKQDLIDELLDDETFIELALAELRKEAKLTFFDSYLVFNYQDLIEYDSDSNEYGISELKDIKKYYTSGLYSSKNIARVNGVTLSLELDEETNTYNITGQSVSKKLKDRSKLTADDLYEYAMARHGASYIASVKLNKTVKAMSEYTLIHGTDLNYTTSDNWRMVKYRNQVESLNYYYELAKNYPTVASYYYGLGTYSSLKDYLVTYIGVRSWDRLVNSYMTETTKVLYVYNKLTGKTLDKDVTQDTAYQVLNSYLERFKFQETLDSQFSLDVAHLLIYIDYDGDTYPDTYKDEFTNTTVKEKVDDLKDLAVKYFKTNGGYTSSQITSKSSSTVWNDFVTEYNNASIDDSTYGTFKILGLKVKYEALGSVTETSVESYDEAFKNRVIDLNKAITDETISYNDLTNFYIDTDLIKSSFGEHLIIVKKTDDYEKETVENLTVSVAEYLQKKAYESLFGSTDNPDQYANQVYKDLKYANLTVEDSDALESLFSTELSYLTESAGSYISTYIILDSLKDVDASSTYGKQIANLISAYEYTLFEE